MIVILHVAIALISIILASYAYLHPTVSKLRSSYAFIALTLSSGFYLVWTTPSQMIHACMTGVAYLAVVTAITVLARQKLARYSMESVENR